MVTKVKRISLTDLIGSAFLATAFVTLLSTGLIGTQLVITGWIIYLFLLGWVMSVIFLVSMYWQWRYGDELVRRVEIFVSQKLVDQVLRERALEFDYACKKEIALRGDDHRAPEKLGSLQKEVEKAKCRFWEAHGTAQKLGFIVKNVWGAYL